MNLSKTLQTNTHSDRTGLTLLILTGIWVLTTLGTGMIPLERHETFVLESAREMRASGDWVLPYYNGEPRLQKPPFSYWATVAVSFLDPFSSDVEIPHGRFISLAAGLVMVLLTSGLASRLYGWEVGLLSGLILMSMPGYIRNVHNARPDFLYATFCTLQLFAWIAAWRADDRSRQQAIFGLLGWTGAALATLTKGPQVPAVFLLGLLIFLVYGPDRKRALRILRPVAGALVFLALAAPWWILLQNRLTSLGIAITDTQLSGSLLHQLASWKELFSGYYLYTLFLLTLPASLAVPFFLYWRRKNSGALTVISRLLLSVGITYLVLFTIAGHYRKHYLIPLLPIASLYLADAMHRNRSFFESPGTPLRRFLWIALVIAAGGSAVLVAHRGAYLSLAILLTGACLIFILLSIRQGRSGLQSPGTIPAAFALTALSFAIYNNYLTLDKERADRQSFALEIRQTLGPEDLLLTWNLSPGGIPFFTKRIVPMVTGPDELNVFIATKPVEGSVFALLSTKQLPNIRSSFNIEVLPVTGYDYDDETELVLVRVNQPSETQQHPQ